MDKQRKWQLAFCVLFLTIGLFVMASCSDKPDSRVGNCYPVEVEGAVSSIDLDRSFVRVALDKEDADHHGREMIQFDISHLRGDESGSSRTIQNLKVGTRVRILFVMPTDLTQPVGAITLDLLSIA